MRFQRGCEGVRREYTAVRCGGDFSTRVNSTDTLAFRALCFVSPRCYRSPVAGSDV